MIHTSLHEHECQLAVSVQHIEVQEEEIEIVYEHFGCRIIHICMSDTIALQ